MPNRISCQDLKSLMDSGESYAIFDVREQVEYDKKQISTATSLPRGQIEFRLPSLVPSRKVPIFLYDGGGERAALASETMQQMGYEKIFLLEGGLTEWVKAGFPTVSGLNVPSKLFGEKVHYERKVSEITPEKLKALIESQKDLLILDVRTPKEHRRFCIPGAINVPGGDLIHWAEALSQKTDKTVVVHCTGRTRSIIGAATLQRLGLSNVYALKNGTMGWVLADLDLEDKPKRESPFPELKVEAKSLAQKIVVEEEIPMVSTPELLSVIKETDRDVLYLIDVRSEKEYAMGHIPGSLCIPGGQAVQRADDYIAVKNAQIVFVSHEEARAVMAAYWYRQMGFKKVSVLKEGIEGWEKLGESLAPGPSTEEPFGLKEARESVRSVTHSELDFMLRQDRLMVLDVGTSLEFRAKHVCGAQWLSRGWLESKFPMNFPDRKRAFVVTCPNGQQSALAASTLKGLGYTRASILEGGVRAWTAAGYPIEKGLDGCLIEPDDIVPSPAITGDKESMKRYLEWEIALTK